MLTHDHQYAIKNITKNLCTIRLSLKEIKGKPLTQKKKKIKEQVTTQDTPQDFETLMSIT